MYFQGCWACRDVYCLGHLKKTTGDCVVTVYDRVLLQGKRYHSADYKRVKGRNSYTVHYLSKNKQTCHFGHVMHYQVQKLNCNCKDECAGKWSWQWYQDYIDKAQTYIIGKALGLKALEYFLHKLLLGRPVLTLLLSSKSVLGPAGKAWTIRP